MAACLLSEFWWPETLMHLSPDWIAEFCGKRAIICFHAHMTYDIGLRKERSRVHEEIHEQMADRPKKGAIKSLTCSTDGRCRRQTGPRIRQGRRSGRMDLAWDPCKAIPVVLMLTQNCNRPQGRVVGLVDAAALGEASTFFLFVFSFTGRGMKRYFRIMAVVGNLFGLEFP